ncbi:MAG: hypothetical protein HY231_00685 [Acidobacteria bacterium]|nr:hypothetical protein [Acidobacteriota bacterium]
MKFSVSYQAFVLLFFLLLNSFGLLASALQEVQYGPEVKSFLELCHHEEVELDYQIRHHEIARKDFIRSKNRIAIQRQMVLKRVADNGEDLVPDLQVVTAEEISQLIEDGLKAVKGAKPGALINKKWIYLGTANRGEAYYIFERTQDLSNVTRPRVVTRNAP